MFGKLICFIAHAASLQAADTGKIRILIFSGANNHSWKTSTPVLQKICEESGRFTVTITEDVPNLDPAEFAKYDGIVCNYTSWPVVDGCAHSAKTKPRCVSIGTSAVSSP